MIKLPNGITLDPKGAWAESATNYAHRRGFKNIVCFLATHSDGKQTYILVEYPEENGEGQVIDEDTSFEGIGSFIDVMWLNKKFKE